MKLIATNIRAETLGNMSNMTTSGNIKAAAERIVIVFPGIMMTESLCDRLQCDRLHAEIVVNEMMTSVLMMVEIVVIAMVMIGLVVMAISGHKVAGGGSVDWVCPRSSCGLQP